MCCRFSLVLIVACAVLLTTTVSASEPPSIQLASKYRNNIQIQDYFVSEKLDGVRAYWDGTHLISRGGHIFSSPEWFTKGFPKVALDGELWIAPNQFDLVSGIVRQKRLNNQRWRQVKFMMFDIPTSTKPFRRRVQRMLQILQSSTALHLGMIEQRQLANKLELNNALDSVLAKGGEGLMLHKADALYIAARSKKLLKLKKYQDAEAVVIEHIAGKGKFENILGALVVELPSGTRFKIGSGFSKAQRENPPKIGSVITFKYYGVTQNNIPRFASFLRERPSSVELANRTSN
ncbi:DNA ligase [Psychrobium sp. 1_MG-2023]|uniref:DNA ligase n=1 Tax=Psychrobium sp. 1_MG-2023 TaxID=3062624 RepID=UPI000C33733B|nr:DNA ligase [Psychrobium sp. 1_MG-2023]MDP2562503.1 DNA ligase [Psychrobium sp. 1_MG-2023]PKF54336.1 DNA ligase [Alteromonadales bacterium alter-6D02]